MISHYFRNPFFPFLFYSGSLGILLIFTMAITSVGCGGKPPPPAVCKPCKDCKDGWMFTKDIMGGLECMHGPHLNPNCTKPEGGWVNFNHAKECKELNGGVGNCECFQCGLSNDCVGEILLWLAWCDFKDKDHENGPCQIEKLINSKTGKPVYAPVRFERKAKIPNGKPCEFGKNGFVLGTFCGLDDGMPHSCVSTNGCESYGAWYGSFGAVDVCSTGNKRNPQPPIIKKEGGDPIFLYLPDGQLKQIQ